MPVVFTSARHELPTPVMAEVYVSRLLNRDAVSPARDRFRTRAAIIANLS